MSKFWIGFIVNESISVAQAFVAGSSIAPGLKAALENFITAGQGVVAALNLA